MEKLISEPSPRDDIEECKIPLQGADVNSKEVPGGDEDREASSAATTCRPWYEYADTVLSLFTFLALGFNFSILCQTLLDLERITNADTNQISNVFLYRGIGHGLACICLGFLFDHFNRNLIICLCMVLTGVCQASMPFQTNAMVLSIIFGIQAIGVGLASVGVTLTMVGIWKTRSGPFLQAQYLMYIVAGCLSPFIINAFVRMDTKNNTSTNASYIDDSNIDLLVTSAEINGALLDPQEYNHTFYSNFTEAKMDSIQDNSSLIPTHDIIPVYLLCASYIIIISVICIPMAIVVGPICIDKIRTKTIDESHRKKKRQAADSVKCSSDDVLKVAMLTAMMILELCIECTFQGLIISFVVKELHWTEEDALFLSSILFLTSGVTRLLAVIISRFVSDIFIITFDCLLGTIAVSILAGLVHHHRCVIWVCVIALGAAYSNVMPSTLAWAGNQVKVSGIITSIFVSPQGTGLIFGPRVVGFFFQQNGPMWFAYMLCIYVVALDVLFILTFVICKIRPLKDMDNTEAVKEVKDDIYLMQDLSKSA